MDPERVQEEAKHIQSPGTLATPQEINTYTDALILQLQRIANTTTPRKKEGIGQYNNPWWDLACAETTTAARRARRAYIATRTRQNWDNLKALNQAQARAIKAAQRRYWRRMVAEASQHDKRIWALEKWARLRNHKPPDPPQMPPTRARLYSHYPHRKAAILAERFFPHPPADLVDTDATATNIVAETTSRIDTSQASQTVVEEEIVEIPARYRALEGARHRRPPTRVARKWSQIGCGNRDFHVLCFQHSHTART